MEPRPFTVIGGFLGAGKTTLLNRVLAGAAGRRFAVLVNDFGAVNIDADMIEAHDGQTIALANGCICCSLADGFVTAMLRLMEDPSAFDHVVVEASGVAKPGRIMDFARLDPLLSPDAIVTLADAETLAARLADPLVGETVHAQIAEADLLVLNKVDIAPDPEVAEALLRRLNPDAPLLRADHADLPIEVLLGTGLASGEIAGAHPHFHSEEEDDHDHTAPFHAVVLESPEPLDRAAFTGWAAALPASVLRGKGPVVLAGEGAFLWQKTGARSELTRTDRDARTRIVLIATAPLTPAWPPA